MEATWGQGHLPVLSEDETHRWLLGVCGLLYFFILGSSFILILSKILQYFKNTLVFEAQTGHNVF